MTFPFEEGALGPIRNRKTAHKITQNRKTAINFDQNQKPHSKSSKPKFTHPNFQNPNRSDTLVTRGAYGTNYINFITL